MLGLDFCLIFIVAEICKFSTANPIILKIMGYFLNSFYIIYDLYKILESIHACYISLNELFMFKTLKSEINRNWSYMIFPGLVFIFIILIYNHITWEKWSCNYWKLGLKPMSFSILPICIN